MTLLALVLLVVSVAGSAVLLGGACYGLFCLGRAVLDGAAVEIK